MSLWYACAEFAIKNKDIFSYRFNKHRSHKYSTPNKNFLNTTHINHFMIYFLITVKEKIQNIILNTKNIPKKGLCKISKIFLNKRNKRNFSFKDYLINYCNYIQMNYFYIRHKLYNHYFNYLYSKFFIK